jgi:hypothetical protein
MQDMINTSLVYPLMGFSFLVGAAVAATVSFFMRLARG